MKFTLLSGLCGLFLAFNSYGQSYDLTLAEDTPAEVKVTGTSTLHDWTVTSAQVSEIPQQLTLDTGSDQLINAFGFKIAVADLDGGRGASMNTKIKTAFKSDNHPFIQYQQSQVSSKQVSADQVQFVSKGTLTMAGLEKEVTVQVKAHKSGTQWQFTGNYAMNMSDFEMDPPTAMFGQIKTHDPVVVHFTFNYQIKNP